MTEDEIAARHEEFLHNKSISEQYKKEDPSYQADGTKFDDMTAGEREDYKGTRELTALPKEKRTSVGGRTMDDDAIEALAQTGDMVNYVYPGCTYTYQWIHDNAVSQNPSWGCQSFLTWDCLLYTSDAADE